MKRRTFLSVPAAAAVAAGQTPERPSDRELWIQTLDKIARPVLYHLAHKQLKAKMPVQGKTADRPEYTHLEALGRTLTGIAPWLELKEPADEPVRGELAALARQAIDSVTDPASPDYCNFERGSQPLVDAAFLAHALLRAPGELWRALPD